MKLYVASSWRNAHQPAIVAVLRAAGHEVYDFRNPAPGNIGFSWREVDPLYQHGSLVSAAKWRQLVDSPVARDGYALDFGAMQWADACVYVLPCGRSASFEAGWFFGAGKPIVVVALDAVEPELMFREAQIVGSLAGMLDAISDLSRGTSPVAADAKPEEQQRQGGGGDREATTGALSAASSEASRQDVAGDPS